MKKAKPKIIVPLIVNSQHTKQTSSSIDRVPEVKQNATFEVEVTRDIPYAEGLYHENINSPNYFKKPLKLDVYEPNNKQKKQTGLHVRTWREFYQRF